MEWKPCDQTVLIWPCNFGRFVLQPDVAWTWDVLFTEVAAEINKGNESESEDH